MGLLNTLFGKRTNQLTEILKQGATIIDVRTPAEYGGGHIDGAINIPLNQLTHKLNKIKQMKSPFVLYCASGMRSATAKNILISNNINDVYNGGSISKVNRLLNK